MEKNKNKERIQETLRKIFQIDNDDSNSTIYLKACFASLSLLNEIEPEKLPSFLTNTNKRSKTEKLQDIVKTFDVTTLSLLNSYPPRIIPTSKRRGTNKIPTYNTWTNTYSYPNTPFVSTNGNDDNHNQDPGWLYKWLYGITDDEEFNEDFVDDSTSSDSKRESIVFTLIKETTKTFHKILQRIRALVTYSARMLKYTLSYYIGKIFQIFFLLDKKDTMIDKKPPKPPSTYDTILYAKESIQKLLVENEFEKLFKNENDRDLYFTLKKHLIDLKRIDKQGFENILPKELETYVNRLKVFVFKFPILLLQISRENLILRKSLVGTIDHLKGLLIMFQDESSQKNKEKSSTTKIGVNGQRMGELDDDDYDYENDYDFDDDSLSEKLSDKRYRDIRNDLIEKLSSQGIIADIVPQSILTMPAKARTWQQGYKDTAAVAFESLFMVATELSWNNGKEGFSGFDVLFTNKKSWAHTMSDVWETVIKYINNPVKKVVSVVTGTKTPDSIPTSLWNLGKVVWFEMSPSLVFNLTARVLMKAPTLIYHMIDLVYHITALQVGKIVMKTHPKLASWLLSEKVRINVVFGITGFTTLLLTMTQAPTVATSSMWWALSNMGSEFLYRAVVKDFIGLMYPQSDNIFVQDAIYMNMRYFFNQTNMLFSTTFGSIAIMGLSWSLWGAGFATNMIGGETTKFLVISAGISILQKLLNILPITGETISSHPVGMSILGYFIMGITTNIRVKKSANDWVINPMKNHIHTFFKSISQYNSKFISGRIVKILEKWNFVESMMVGDEMNKERKLTNIEEDAQFLRDIFISDKDVSITTTTSNTKQEKEGLQSWTVSVFNWASKKVEELTSLSDDDDDLWVGKQMNHPFLYQDVISQFQNGDNIAI